MRRDSLFYLLFQQFPELLFDLLSTPPDNAADYRFDSVAVKEPKFEIDGVFLPPEGTPGTIFFCEVQFQKDTRLYERLFGELFLYFYRQRDRFENWQAVIIYPTRSTEQSSTLPYNVLLSSDQVHRVFLDELGQPSQLPLNVGLLVLTTVSDEEAPRQARALLGRINEVEPNTERQAIISLIVTILSYRFTEMSRQEVEAMLDIRFQETRLYQEVKEEGRQEGEVSLVLRQLRRRFGPSTSETEAQVSELPLPLLEDLGEALLDFDELSDLTTWLEQHPPAQAD
ncbi:MAG: Rpn family recombination-promoting nuclease/putative transposase [Cyanobacteria bacterium P01_D01_bin.14]